MAVEDSADRVLLVWVRAAVYLESPVGNRILDEIPSCRGNTVMADSLDVPSTRKTLLLRIREPGDSESWRTFVELYSPLVYHFCLRRGLQEADCQDVVQNVLLSVHRQIPNFEYDRARGLFRNWLITLILREINRYQSSVDQGALGRGGGLGDLLAEQVEREEGQVWDKVFRQRVCELAMERIRVQFAPNVFAAFEATWYYERKPADVAREVGESPAWVYQAKYRVLKRLKQEIEFLGNERFSHLLE